MSKKGQIDISFGMIFSIFIIIAILDVSFYVITHFLNLNKCTQVAFFYDNLQKNVDAAWKSSISSKDFNAKLPGAIDYLCFGNLSRSTGLWKEQIEDLQIYKRSGSNSFLYPRSNTCDSSGSNKKIEHLADFEFFCVEAKNGAARFRIVKGADEALPKIIK